MLKIYSPVLITASSFLTGEFGIVYKAHLLPQMQLDSKLSCCPLLQTVAVKTLKGRYHHPLLVSKAAIVKYTIICNEMM